VFFLSTLLRCFLKFLWDPRDQPQRVTFFSFFPGVLKQNPPQPRWVGLSPFCSFWAKSRTEAFPRAFSGSLQQELTSLCASSALKVFGPPIPHQSHSPPLLLSTIFCSSPSFSCHRLLPSAGSASILALHTPPFFAAIQRAEISFSSFRLHLTVQSFFPLVSQNTVIFYGIRSLFLFFFWHPKTFLPEQYETSLSQYPNGIKTQGPSYTKLFLLLL